MTNYEILENMKQEINEVMEKYKILLEPERNQTGTKPEPHNEIPEEIKADLTPQGQYLVKHMLKTGMIETDDLYKSGTIKSIKTNEKTIIARNSSREAVNKCIDRVMNEYHKGNVKNLNGYFQKSLERLRKDD